MRAEPVGRVRLANGGDVWVMRHLMEVTDWLRDITQRAADQLVQHFSPSDNHRVLRAHKPMTQNTLRAIVEVPVTMKAPPGAFEPDESAVGSPNCS